MKPDDVIADLVQSHGDLCALDKLHLPYDRASAGPAAKFGLGCELFMPNADRQQLREEARDFLIDYQTSFADKVDQFLPRDQRRTVKIKDDLATRLQAEYEKFPPDTGYGASLFGAVDVGLPKDDVEPYQAHVLVKRVQYAELSYVSATIPVCIGNGHTHFDSLLQAVLRWCGICHPVHGTGGFALVFASGMSQNTKYALHLMKRFPGFDYVHGIDFASDARDVENQIKCVNWLTVLGDKIVGELGGIEPMRHALEPACKVHEYPGGVVIQAGEAPQLGDTYRNDIPEAYRMVARYTKPVRFEDYRSRLFRVPDNLDKKEETLAWVRRFD
ncbi:type VI immunity family protein [Trinickia sp. YCB016]